MQFLWAIILAGVLLSVQVLPSLLRYLGADLSMALGTGAACAIILSVFLAAQTNLGRYREGADRRFEWGPFVFAVACVLLVVPHAAIANYFQTTDLERFLKTLPLLVLLLGGGIAFGRTLLRATDSEIGWALALSLSILCISLLLRISGLQPHTSEVDYEKPIFPFTEISHFALAFAPVWLYHCVSSKGRSRSAWLLFGFIVSLALHSLTLLIACFLAAIVCRRILLVSLIGLVLAFGVVPYQLNYFISRLDLSDGVDNLSALVYVQGWQLVVEAMTRSFGWGVGFQQLGVQGTNVPAAETIYLLSKIDALNILDGGFVFAKLAAEFGLLGVLLGVLFVFAAVRSILVLRRERERPVIVFARCVLVCFSVDMFVRGTGYFAGSTLLAITAVSILVSDRKRLRLLAGNRVHGHAIPA